MSCYQTTCDDVLPGLLLCEHPPIHPDGCCATVTIVLPPCRGVESIVRLTELKLLALHDCNSITNKGILLLSQLTRLDTLSLRGCRKLTDTGFDFINVSRGSVAL